MVGLIGVLTLTSLIAATICRVQDAGSVSCPEEVLGEIGTNIAVQCTIGGNLDLLYWYRGTPTQGALPILSLEDGQFGGSKYNDGVYELAENGWMTMNNVQLLHEGTYTLQVYFADGTVSTSSSTVHIYVRPHRPCPTIDSCNSTCKKCHLERDNDGVLKCYINGARPKLIISWEIVRQHSMNFVTNQPVYTEWGDEWNSSVIITYKPAECDAYAVLRCVVLNSPYALENAAVAIKTESCPSNSQNQASTANPAGMTTGSPGSGTVAILVLLVILAILVASCMGVGVYCYRTKRRGTSPDNNRQTLVKNLVDSYMDRTCVEPGILVNPEVYKNYKCIYNYKDGSTEVGTVNDLYSSGFRKKNDRVLIVAPIGYGKRTTTKKLLVKWSNTQHKYLLLYIPMCRLERGRNVFEMVKELYAQGTELTADDIGELFKNYECFVLLGGLEELDNDNLVSDRSDVMLGLSFRNLLDGTVNDDYKHITVWVTSRDDNKVISLFGEPYTKVTIKGELDVPE